MLHKAQRTSEWLNEIRDLYLRSATERNTKYDSLRSQSNGNGEPRLPLNGLRLLGALLQSEFTSLLRTANGNDQRHTVRLT